MFHDILESIKLFLTVHEKHAWVEHHFLYFAILGFFIGMGFWLIKLQRDINKLNKHKLKRDKLMLKLLSNKKNKTS